MTEPRVLVTGACGCIGAWTLATLVQEGTSILAADLSDDRTRPALLMADDALAKVEWTRLDVTDRAAVVRTIGDEGITHIVHLAGLQVPFCKANPSLGAAVNVVGTVNLFEAAREHVSQVQGLAYASSIAAMGRPSFYGDGLVADDAPRQPQTLYGVYKQANEDTARIYWQDWEIPSVGLRPYIVYGVGRDQGLTSDLAKAILAAVAGRPYAIKFSGKVALQYAPDTAAMFLGSARSGHRGAAVCNLRNDVLDVEEFAAKLREIVPGTDVTVAKDKPLPFPAELEDRTLKAVLGGSVPHTPLEDAIRDTAQRFESLLSKGAIDLSQLEA
ncbi:MAG: NAD(P)-dependent oxidoreductase [Planctomycetota bacterium]